MKPLAIFENITKASQINNKRYSIYIILLGTTRKNIFQSDNHEHRQQDHSFGIYFLHSIRIFIDIEHILAPDQYETK